MTQNLSEHELSRRTIVKGAAWSLPVIAAAAATPFAAASGGAIQWPTNPNENGTGGTLSYNNNANELTGRQEAYYSVEVTGTGMAQTPVLTATFTATGPWVAPVTFSATTGGAALAQGQVLRGRNSPLQWTVASVTPTTLILVAAAQEISAGSQSLATPRIWVAGSADTATGGLAQIGVELSGGVGTVTGTNGATIPTA